MEELAMLVADVKNRPTSLSLAGNLEFILGHQRTVNLDTAELRHKWAKRPSVDTSVEEIGRILNRPVVVNPVLDLPREVAIRMAHEVAAGLSDHKIIRKAKKLTVDTIDNKEPLAASTETTRPFTASSLSLEVRQLWFTHLRQGHADPLPPELQTVSNKVQQEKGRYLHWVKNQVGLDRFHFMHPQILAFISDLQRSQQTRASSLYPPFFVFAGEFKTASLPPKPAGTYVLKSVRHLKTEGSPPPSVNTAALLEHFASDNGAAVRLNVLSAMRPGGEPRCALSQDQFVREQTPSVQAALTSSVLSVLFDANRNAAWHIPFEVRESQQQRCVVFDKPLPRTLSPQEMNAKFCRRALKHTLSANSDNVNYDIWRLDNLLLLIRCRKQVEDSATSACCTVSSKQHYFLPKSPAEKQNNACFGPEIFSPSELSRMWVRACFRPHRSNRILVGHVDMTPPDSSGSFGDVVLTEIWRLSETLLRPELEGFNQETSLQRVHYIISNLLSFSPGHYLLQKRPREHVFRVLQGQATSSPPTVTTKTTAMTMETEDIQASTTMQFGQEASALLSRVSDKPPVSSLTPPLESPNTPTTTTFALTADSATTPTDLVPTDFVTPTPAATVPADTADIVPADTAPADIVPADTAPTAPADTAPADTAPADTADTTDTDSDTDPTDPPDTAPTDTALDPADSAPIDTLPIDTADTAPTDTPTDTAPTDTTPTDTPADTTPTDTTPTDTTPTDTTPPTSTVPTGTAHIDTAPDTMGIPYLTTAPLEAIATVDPTNGAPAHPDTVDTDIPDHPIFDVADAFADFAKHVSTADSIPANPATADPATVDAVNAEAADAHVRAVRPLSVFYLSGPTAKLPFLPPVWNDVPIPQPAALVVPSGDSSELVFAEPVFPDAVQIPHTFPPFNQNVDFSNTHCIKFYETAKCPHLPNCPLLHSRVKLVQNYCHQFLLNTCTRTKCSFRHLTPVQVATELERLQKKGKKGPQKKRGRPPGKKQSGKKQPKSKVTKVS